MEKRRKLLSEAVPPSCTRAEALREACFDDDLRRNRRLQLQGLERALLPPVTSGRPRMLEEYARHFPVVEINSTYYAIPAARTPERHGAPDAARVPVHRQGEPRDDPRDWSDGPSVRVSSARRSARSTTTASWAACWRSSPGGSRTRSRTGDYLEALAERLAGHRHGGGVPQQRVGRRRDLRAAARAWGWATAAWTSPASKGCSPAGSQVTGRVAYVRFHGRNSETWWDQGRESWERYDYLYSEEELSEWLPKVELMSEKRRPHLHHLQQPLQGAGSDQRPHVREDAAAGRRRVARRSSTRGRTRTTARCSEGSARLCVSSRRRSFPCLRHDAPAIIHSAVEGECPSG